MSKYNRVYYSDTGKITVEGQKLKNIILKLLSRFWRLVPRQVDFFDVEALLHRCVEESSKEARYRKHNE